MSRESRFTVYPNHCVLREWGSMDKGRGERERERERDRQTDRQTETDRQTGRTTDRGKGASMKHYHPPPSHPVPIFRQ